MIDPIRTQYIKIIEGENTLEDRYHSISRLGNYGGNGFFSILFTAIDSKNDQKVAVKFFDPQKLNDTDRRERFAREADMLVYLRREDLVLNCIGDGIEYLEKTFIDSNTNIPIQLSLPYMVLELAEFDIEKVIYDKNYDTLKKLIYFKEMVKAISRIHNRRICHRDIKPSNFLIVKGRVKLSDFGASKNMDGSGQNISPQYYFPIGDKHYISPELVFSIGIGDEHVFKADVFSLGCIMFELFTKTVLTAQIYTPNILRRLYGVHQVLSQMPYNKRLKTYKLLVNDLSKVIKLPDIFLYNDIPGSIKYHLNDLYKGLVAINFLERNKNFNSIHRKIDICIKILTNEEKYKKWKKERDRRKEIRDRNLEEKRRKWWNDN